MSAETWVISDGAAGNEKQALALARALALQPRVWRLHARAPWRWFAPHGTLGAANAFGADFLARMQLDAPRLAIGCGRQAAFALRVLKRYCGDAIRTLQILDPRIDTQAFDLVIAPVHDRQRGGNVILTRGALNEIDDAWLARAKLEWAQLSTLPAPRTTLLLGGSTRALKLDRHYWQGLAAKLSHWLARDGGSLLVTTSRRSADWLRTRVRADFEALPGLQWHGPTDGPNPYSGMLAWADRIVVTPESVNLLSEACATRVPVLCHFARPVQGKLAHFHRGLLESGRVRPMHSEYAPWELQPLREIAAVASEVRARLGC